MGYQLLAEQLTEAEIKEALDRDGFISVVIPVSLSTIIDGDLEALNDYAEETAVSTGILSDIDYTVVGTGLDNMIHLRVIAGVDLIT
jgi:hypothetical protein